MKLFSGIKMKYRLLLVIFLPTLILLGFDINIFMKDYAAIQRMHEVKEMSSTTVETLNVIGVLQDEIALSAIHASTNDADFSRELTEARQKTTNQISILNGMVSKLNVTINGKSAKSYYEKTLEKLNNLAVKRDQIDSGVISKKDVPEAYKEIIDDLIERVAIIARDSEDLDIARNLFAALALINDQLAGNTERYIILKAAVEDKISTEDLNTLLVSTGEQKGYETSFLVLSNDEQDALYNTIVKGSFISEANRIQSTIIKKGAVGKFGIDPKKWWGIKSEYMAHIQEMEKKLLAENIQISEAFTTERTDALFITIGAIIFTLVMALVLLVYSLRNLTNKLKEEVEVLSASGNEILNSITEASTGTAETATAVTETTTTVEELKQTAQIASEKAKNVSDVSEEALQVLKNSEETLNASISGMNNIQDGMGTISDSIIKLSENSQSIGKIIDSVNDLAEQSHLLAVNAAIEAAKAGDQGRGFVIVAQEMRNLAEQSKQATEQVRSILSDIQNSTSAAVMATERGTKAVSQGVLQSAQVSQSIRSLSLGIANVAQAASQISLSSQQQLIGVGQVTIAMGNIKESSNQHVEQMRQIEAGIKNLNHVGDGLNKLMNEYKF